MTNDHSVLIVSTVADIATDAVVEVLAKASVPHRRINTEDFPFGKTLGLEFLDEGGTVSSISGMALEAPTAVWYRRVRAPAKPDEMQSGIYEFCVQEARSALLGGLLTLDCRWMSHPAAVWQAEFKPFQLSVAKRLGLAIPRTIVSSDPKEIRSAFDRFRGMVVKPVRTGYVAFDGKERAVFTSRVLCEHLDDLEQAPFNSSIYQELVAKKFDIRATIVGDLIFSAAIDSQTDPAAEIDWRHTVDPNLPHYRINLPREIENKLFALMRELRLTFGAVDLVQDLDGNFVFLEVNPNGQWLWIEDLLELGISAAIADWLAKA